MLVVKRSEIAERREALRVQARAQLAAEINAAVAANLTELVWVKIDTSNLLLTYDDLSQVMHDVSAADYSVHSLPFFDDEDGTPQRFRERRVQAVELIIAVTSQAWQYYLTAMQAQIDTTQDESELDTARLEQISLLRRSREREDRFFNRD